jgi:hypothetical protein
MNRLGEKHYQEIPDINTTYSANLIYLFHSLVSCIIRFYLLSDPQKIAVFKSWNVGEFRSSVFFHWLYPKGK